MKITNSHDGQIDDKLYTEVVRTVIEDFKIEDLIDSIALNSNPDIIVMEFNHKAKDLFKKDYIIFKDVVLESLPFYMSEKYRFLDTFMTDVSRMFSVKFNEALEDNDRAVTYIDYNNFYKSFDETNYYIMKNNIMTGVFKKSKSKYFRKLDLDSICDISFTSDEAFVTITLYKKGKDKSMLRVEKPLGRATNTFFTTYFLCALNDKFTRLLEEV